MVNTSGDVGLAAADAAKLKIAIHARAVHERDGIFIPCALEPFGHMDKSTHDLIEAIADQLPKHRQYSFRLDMSRAISTALAKWRVVALLTAMRSSTYSNV